MNINWSSNIETALILLFDILIIIPSFIIKNNTAGQIGKIEREKPIRSNCIISLTYQLIF